AWHALGQGKEAECLALFDAGWTPSRWVDASRAVLLHEPARAAEILAEMEAAPEEAFTRMRSGEPAQVDRALAFYRSVGAARYVRECEHALAATAWSITERTSTR